MFKIQTLAASLEEVKEFFLLHSFFFFFFSGFVLEVLGSFVSSSFWGFVNRNGCASGTLSFEKWPKGGKLFSVTVVTDKDVHVNYENHANSKFWVSLNSLKRSCQILSFTESRGRKKAVFSTPSHFCFFITFRYPMNDLKLCGNIFEVKRIFSKRFHTFKVKIQNSSFNREKKSFVSIYSLFCFQKRKIFKFKYKK